MRRRQSGKERDNGILGIGSSMLRRGLATEKGIERGQSGQSIVRE